MSYTKQNPEKAIRKAIKADKAPYILCGDINVDPEASLVVVVAIESGLLIDFGHAWASVTEDTSDNPRKQPDNTFAEGPTPGI